MIKPSKRLVAVLASAGIFACTLGTYNANANDIIYTDSNVSISSALDRYIATNEEEFVVETVATLSDAKAEEMVATGSITIQSEEVSADATGSITEEETTEEAANATQYSSNEDFAGKALVVIADTVNIRAAADVDSERVGSIGARGLMTVVEQGDEWSHITSGNCEGYIKNEFIAFGDDAAAYAEANLDKVAVVEASALKLRAGEGEDTECLTLLAQGEKYHILSQGDEWTQVLVDETLSGYVKNEYVSVAYDTVTATTVAEEEAANQSAQEDAAQENDTDEQAETTEAPESEESQSNEADTTTEAEEPATEAPTSEAPASALGVDVANYALQFVGNPYVYGGTSLTNGADCSGFVMKIYEHFGYSLPRTADVQGTVGTEINLSSVAPGDLIFYDHGSGSIQHVAICIGNGQIVHASNSRTGIIVSNMYYSTPCKAVRIIN